jgi:hypothetical protein
MFELKHERNKLFWSYFHISSIMRPVCFVVTPETQFIFTNWCHNFSNNFRYNVDIIYFWCFPYEYCDRSDWNTISDDVKNYFAISNGEKEYIQQIPTGYEPSESDERSCVSANDTDNMSIEEY